MGSAIKEGQLAIYKISVHGRFVVYVRTYLNSVSYPSKPRRHCNVGGYFRAEFAFIFINVGHGYPSTNTQTRMQIFAKLSLLKR